jgi:hypothetical protein
MNFTNGVWAVEYARGLIPLSMPFGLVDELVSCIDLKTAAQTVTLYTDLVAQALGHRAQAALGPAAGAGRLVSRSVASLARRCTQLLEPRPTLKQIPRDNPR